MGITSYCIISSNKGLDTFQQLTETYDLGKCDFFKYLQLRHYFDDAIKTFGEKEVRLIRIFIDVYKCHANRKLVFQDLFIFTIGKGSLHNVH